MTDSQKFIDWFWLEAERILKLSRFRQSGEAPPSGFCQCQSPTLIRKSENPERMTAFLIIGLVLDEAAERNLPSYKHGYTGVYGSFHSLFRFPIINHHFSGSGKIEFNQLFPNNWDYDHDIDWHAIQEVASILIADFYQWLDDSEYTFSLDEVKEAMMHPISRYSGMDNESRGRFRSRLRGVIEATNTAIRLQ